MTDRGGVDQQISPDRSVFLETSPLPSRRRALLLGATGRVGGFLLDLFLGDPAYDRTIVLGRRSVGRSHPRLEERILDFEAGNGHGCAVPAFATVRDAFAVDDVFCALGTTIRKAGSRAAFRRVDVDYVVEAARWAAKMGAQRFLVVSSMGADARSRIAYNRDKGEMEDAVREVPIAVWIFRPSLLLGDRGEFRTGEALASLVFRPLAPLFVGPLQRLRPIHARDVAAAMLAAAHSDRPDGIIESDEVRQMARAASSAERS